MDKASRIALRMIATEETLRNKEVLDQIGTMTRLVPAPYPDTSLLHHVLHSVLAALPPDISEPFVIDATRRSMLFAGSEPARTTVSMFVASDTNGEPVITASIDTLVSSDGDLDQGTATLLSSELNRCNAAMTHGVCVAGPGKHVRVRVGSACSTRASLDNWAKMLAYLVAANAAAVEEAGGPAGTYIELREMETAGVNVFDISSLVQAATAFVASLTPELQSVTHLAAHSDGLAITVPFRVNDMTRALTVIARRVVDDSGKAVGLALSGNLYEDVRWDEALRLVEELNGLDSEIVTSGYWVETTPWLLGRWYVQESGTGKHPVVFSGFVPSALEPYISLESVLSGTVKEVWAASDKYRLRQEFNSAIGGINGPV